MRSLHYLIHRVETNWGETFSYDEDEGLTDETPTTSALSDPNLHRQSQHGFYA
jgi:hypothetical protein